MVLTKEAVLTKHAGRRKQARPTLTTNARSPGCQKQKNPDSKRVAIRVSRGRRY